MEKNEELERWVRGVVAVTPGMRLPSERELASRFALTRPKVRELLQRLQGEGLVETRLGSGTYGVDLSARPLRKIAILVDAQIKLGNDPFFTQVFEQLQAAAQTAGIRCSVERIGSESRLQTVDEAAILLGWAGERLLKSGRLANVPAVALMAGPDIQPTSSCSVFRLDDRAAGRAACEYLKVRGCGQILFIGKDTAGASRERYLGAKDAESPVCDVRLIPCSLNYPAGLKIGQEIHIEQKSKAGIIATNDWLAVGVRAGLNSRANSKSVPIVSFDGLPLTSDPSIGIVSFTVPIKEIASDAILELQRLHRSNAATGRAVVYSLKDPRP